MRLPFLLFACLLFACSPTPPQSVELTNIKIARDKWGVPHIMAPTDAEVAYGLAWAECEDDFITLQEQMAAGKGKLGEIKGQDGLIVDFAIKFMGLPEIAAARYDKEVTGRFKTYLESYADGLNALCSITSR